jgi:hypothetical protein
VAQRNAFKQGVDCPDCGMTLRPLPSGWWCPNPTHDTAALNDAPDQRQGERTFREVKAMRADGPGRNLWRTYELEAYR